MSKDSNAFTSRSRQLDFGVIPLHVQGTAIEATMWREIADKYHPMLEEGKVYLFSKGKVKPANKNYSAVRNDYTISFDSQCVPQP